MVLSLSLTFSGHSRSRIKLLLLKPKEKMHSRFALVFCIVVLFYMQNLVAAISCADQARRSWYCTTGACTGGYRSVFWDTGCPASNYRCCIDD